MSDMIEIGALLLLLLTAGVAILVVFLIWRDGYRRGWRSARGDPPTCPNCGYNLSGLTQCTCPECGRTYRLDELWRCSVLRQGGGSERSDERPRQDDALDDGHACVRGHLTP